ncbi:MAG: hypothetical protein FD121_1094 [Gallionellaceae bacterium]|nr:MAG: hypothetical protein FD121_1094 [Gallionellaceae bacterium]
MSEIQKMKGGIASAERMRGSAAPAGEARPRLV